MENNEVFNFNEFLFESNTFDDGINVVILSAEVKNSTIQLLSSEIKKRGGNCIVIDVNSATLSGLKKDGSVLISDKRNKNGIKIFRENTAILPRRGVLSSTYSKNILSQLESLNFFCVNSLESMEICENKFLTHKKLELADIPVPKTAMIPNERSIDIALKEIGGEFPVIIKTLSGTQGIGVFLVESYGSLKSVLQTLWKVGSNVEILMQEKIDADYDLRVQVVVKGLINGKEPTESVIIGSMMRKKVENDFRTNVHLGGQVSIAKLTEEQEEIAKKATKVIGCHWAGVDIISDKKTGKNYVLELNSSPGTAGMQKATNGDLIIKFVDFIMNKKSWDFPALVIGFREPIIINGIAEMVAKFDTGNGSLSCSMHADKWEEHEDRIDWWLGERKFTNKIVGYSEPKIGDKVIKRPIIEVDLTFAGRNLEKTQVSLVDRSDKSTPFLVNRKTMEKLGVTVNPDKNFVTSKFKGDYEPLEIFGNSLKGIRMLS